MIVALNISSYLQHIRSTLENESFFDELQNILLSVLLEMLNIYYLVFD